MLKMCRFFRPGSALFYLFTKNIYPSAFCQKLTHKRIICQKHFLEGKSVEQTPRETYHSPQAVVRYANDFMRVRECLKEGWSVERIAYTTGLSKSLTKEYADMINETEVLF